MQGLSSSLHLFFAKCCWLLQAATSDDVTIVWIIYRQREKQISTRGCSRIKEISQDNLSGQWKPVYFGLPLVAGIHLYLVRAEVPGVYLSVCTITATNTGTGDGGKCGGTWLRKVVEKKKMQMNFFLSRNLKITVHQVPWKVPGMTDGRGEANLKMLIFLWVTFPFL